MDTALRRFISRVDQWILLYVALLAEWISGYCFTSLSVHPDNIATGGGGEGHLTKHLNIDLNLNF